MPIDRSTSTTESGREAPPDMRAEAARESTLRLGQRLRRARLNRNLTQGEVAKNQFSVSYVSAVERGQIRPSLGALERLAERLEVPITDLLAAGEFNLPGGSYTGSSLATSARESASERHREAVETSLREARILLHRHQSTDAIDLLVQLNSQQLSPREASTVQLWLATCYLQQGRAEEARRAAQEAIPVAERAGERELVERLRNEVGNAYLQMQNPTLALDQYRLCLQAFDDQSIGDPVFKATVLFNTGRAAAAQGGKEGDEATAIATLRQAMEAAQAVLRPAQLGDRYWEMSQALAARGDSAGAKSAAHQSLAAYEEATKHQLVASISTRLGSAFAESGQVQEALAQLQTAATVAAGQQDLRGMAEVQRSLAAVYLDEQRYEEASRAAEEALVYSGSLDDPREHAKSTLVLAQVQEAHKQPREAGQNFENAIALLQTAQEAQHEAEAQEALRTAYAQYSEFLERQGQGERAFEMLKNAYKATTRS